MAASRANWRSSVLDGKFSGAPAPMGVFEPVAPGFGFCPGNVEGVVGPCPGRPPRPGIWERRGCRHRNAPAEIRLKSANRLIPTSYQAAKPATSTKDQRELCGLLLSMIFRRTGW